MRIVQIRLVYEYEYCCSAGVLSSSISEGQHWETTEI